MHFEDRKTYRECLDFGEIQTKAEEAILKMPKLRLVPFEAAKVERFKCRESKVENATIEMYLAGGWGRT